MKKTLLTYLFFLMAIVLHAQGQQVSGFVYDDAGEPLPGVNVLIKGTTKGTVTGISGDYTLAVDEGATLVFSFVGYLTKEVEVGAQSKIDVTLGADIKALDEVVVVGYGTSNKKEVTGSIAAVNGDKLQALNPQRVEQALQGQAAGVNITSASGSPGGALNIRIRGLSTNGNNNPLILVDGVQYSTDGLNSLNPSDIESINVLKDATAGIYGVRAANGVIYITTKKGKKNVAPSFTFNGYYGIQETSNKMDLLNARQYAILKNETYASAGQAPLFENVNLGKGTDWQDEVFGRAPVQNYGITVTGGSEKTTYSVGGSFLDQKGIVGDDKSSFRRYNARLNFVTELAPKVTLENVLLFANEQRRTLPENSIGSILYNTVNASPVRSTRREDGSYSLLEEVTEIVNPLALIDNTYNRAITNKITGKQEIRYEINDVLKATARAGYNYANVTTKDFMPPAYYGSGKSNNSVANANMDPLTITVGDLDVPYSNTVNQGKETYLDYTIEGFLNYDNLFNEVHGLKATAGFSMFGRNMNGLYGTAYNVPYGKWENAEIRLAKSPSTINNTSSSRALNRLISGFLRAEYDYMGKYLFSALIRRDASTNFGENNKSGIFTSYSGAWVITDEDFFDVDWLQFAKIRASYGVSGNDQIADFAYKENLTGEGVYPFNDASQIGTAIGQYGNKDLKWETTHQADFGLDATVLKGDLDVTLDYYIKTTKDLLFAPEASALIGAYGPGGLMPIINAGSVRNSGLELALSYNKSIGDDFSFNVNYNLTTVKNEVIEMPDGVPFLQYGSFSVGGDYTSRMMTGQPLGVFYGYKTDGVYQTEEEIASRGVTQANAHPGDLRFKDIDGNGEISFGDDNDKTVIGSPIPDVTMGLNLGANYKNFDLSMNFYASIGNDILRNYERQLPKANLMAYRMDRWTGPGSTNENPRLTNEETNNNIISDYFVEDGSFLRLKNIQIGYKIPSELLKRIGANQFRVYASVSNLFTLTKYMGYDPDFNSGSSTAPGVDYGFYPQPRTYMLGVNLKF